MKNIMKLALLSTVSLMLPFLASASDGELYSEGDETLHLNEDEQGYFNGATQGYVKAIHEIEPALETQVLLLSMTYEDETMPASLSEDVSVMRERYDKNLASYQKGSGSFQSIGHLTEKLKKDTGADGDFKTGFLTFSSDEKSAFNSTMSYDELMNTADVAKENGDIQGIYSAYMDYNSGLYKESILNQMRAELSDMEGTQLAFFSIKGESSDVLKNWFGMMAGMLLPSQAHIYSEFEKRVKSTQKNGASGYDVGFEYIYPSLNVFQTIFPEYALFKFNLAEASGVENGIKWMESVISDNMLEDGTVDGNNLASKKYNMFQSQALAAVFSNSIAFRETTQRYINSKDNVSAFGSEAGNDRSNWYALNVLTTGLVKVLGWQAAIDAGNVEYESSFRIKTLSKKDKGDK